MLDFYIDQNNHIIFIIFLYLQLGGATAQIGDPSGRNTERSPMEISVIENNVQRLHESIKQIFTNHEKFLWKHEKRLKTVECV